MPKSIKRNMFFNVVSTLINIIYPLVTFPYASRMLGADNIGKVQYCYSVINYFTILSTLGVSVYAVRAGAKYRDNKDELTKFLKEILTIVSFAMVFSYIVFGLYLVCFFKNSFYLLMIISSISMLFCTYSTDWLYQIEEDYLFISKRTMILQFLSMAAVFILVRKKSDYVVYTLISEVCYMVNIIYSLIHARKYVNYKTKYRLEIKKHISPIFEIFGISVAASVYMNLDTVMLGIMKTMTDVGMYAVAVKMAFAVKTLIISFSNVLFPRLSNYIGTNREEEYKTLLKKGVRFMIFITMPFAIGLCILSREIILILSGAEYEMAAFAGRVLALNVVFAVFESILYYQVLLPYGKEKQASLCTWGGAVCNFILNLILIPRFSYNGAAVTTFITEILVFVGLLIFAERQQNLNYMPGYVLRYTIYSMVIVISFIIAKWLFASVLPVLIITVICSVLLYLLALKITKDPMLEELERAFHGKGGKNQ